MIVRGAGRSQCPGTDGGVRVSWAGNFPPLLYSGLARAVLEEWEPLPPDPGGDVISFSW